MPCTKITVSFRPAGLSYEQRSAVLKVVKSGIECLSKLHAILRDTPGLGYMDCQATIETLYAGRVIKSWYETCQVMSDEWADFRKVAYLAADGSCVEEWADGAPAEERDAAFARCQSAYDIFAPDEVVYWSGYYWSVDADEETKAIADAWYDEQKRIANVKRRAKAMARWITDTIVNELRVGKDKDTVVVKGRKIKKGTLVRVVVDRPRGQYGPTVDVVDDKGNTIRYVNPDNLMVVPHWEGVFDRGVSDYNLESKDIILAILKDYAATTDESALAWAVLCDCIADMDAGDYSGDEFAAALRKLGPQIPSE